MNNNNLTKSSFTNFFDDFFFNENKTYFDDYEIIENDENYKVKMYVPGVKKEDFKVEVDDNFLSIDYTRKESDETGVYIKKRPREPSFNKKFQLSNKLDADRTEVFYRDGVLDVIIPIKENKRRKSLSIKIK